MYNVRERDAFSLFSSGIYIIIVTRTHRRTCNISLGWNGSYARIYIYKVYIYVMYIPIYMYMCSNGGDKYVYMVYKGKRKSIVKEKKGRKGCRVAAILFRAHTRCDGHCNRFAASLSLKKCRKSCIHTYIYIYTWNIARVYVSPKKRPTKTLYYYTFFILQPNKTFNRMFYFIFFFYDFFLFELNRIAVKKKWKNRHAHTLSHTHTSHGVK